VFVWHGFEITICIVNNLSRVLVAPTTSEEKEKRPGRPDEWKQMFLADRKSVSELRVVVMRVYR